MFVNEPPDDLLRLLPTDSETNPPGPCPTLDRAIKTKYNKLISSFALAPFSSSPTPSSARNKQE